MFNRAALRVALLGPATATLIAGSGGCGVLDDGGATVFVFSTHHATPENGIFPERGDDDKPRKFLNDQGWEVTLQESYVTISAVSLIDCGGDQHPLDMFWGPCPEDLRGKDLAALTVAGRKLPPGNYCELWLEYGPYETPIIDEDAQTRHQTPDNVEVLGSTVYLRGGARIDQAGDAISFELRATGSAVVELDISALEDGSPLNIANKENFPLELTISKTYDRFFDGIDFENFDAAELQGDLMDILEENTRINLGTTVSIESDED